ncbi:MULTISPECIES: WXG100 family type VII secretion target [Streptococcus]|uniref:ESAT-6-like protein n=1 Tax=Streptococcus pantholopis TaxID=1811193 RepID=A0A172Q517_9STRE|nr:WXG100 family type VII secretion target [Streptococcus pantholopis]AND78525.1 hypothetical protein A0O21_00070 [Streptococcus pantholopis]AND78538.1 hypothetical protein A0O21_00135 [Streptococcus pantholopis]AND78549.1 hypothetical protein A0O21_00190 [Streptococcus pantholopis]
MAEVSLSPEELSSQASVYSTAVEQIETAIQAVERTNGEMQSHWNGQAYQAYLEQYNQLRSDVTKFEELLTSVNQQLTSYASVVSERDTSDAGQFTFQ